VQVSFLTPVAVDTKGVLKGKSISSFAFHSQTSSVSVISEKRVYSWGGNARTPIENLATNSGDLKDQDIIQTSGNYFSEIYGCVMTSSDVYCSDELSRENTSKPVKISTESTLGGRPISKVFSNGSSSCLISVGSLYCWGINENGQLGNHSVKNSTVPVPVKTIETLKDREVLAVSFSGNVTYVLHRAMSAEAKAAAEKAAAEEVTKAKAAAEKAAADAATALKARQEAEAKAKADAEIKAKADTESALAKAVAELRSATQTIAKLNDTNAELNRIIQALTDSNKNQQSQIDALNARITSLLVPKPTTIVCTKGTSTKTVKGINPTCPAGFKKK
jgi:chemotaxis protein histidine kinase CheA